VVGPNNNANDINSVAIGNNCPTDGWHSIAIGTFAKAISTAINSVSIGTYTKSVAGESFVFGQGISDTYPLQNYVQQSIMFGTNSNLPTLFVSRSGGYNKTGRIGIGNIVDPEVKLHLYADDGEDAAIFIQPHNWVYNEYAILMLGTQNK